VAPERLDGQPAQTATDVYCLGVLLFEMLTGVPPFPEDTWNPEAPLRDRAAPKPRGVPGLPAAVARLVQRCLARDPAGRPPAREVADRLAAYARPWWRGPAVIAAAAVPVAAAVAVVVLGGGLPGAGSATTPTTSGPGAVAVGPSAPSSSPSSSTSDSGTANASSPAVGASASSTVESSPPPKPAAGQQPPVASVPVEQALDDLRATIDASVPSGMDSDTAQILRNNVEDIARRLLANPNADVTASVDNLRQVVLTRSTTDRDASGNPRINAATRDALLARIETLRKAVTPTA
jgi:eukaryotic-like serine/threonine-protein kinase